MKVSGLHFPGERDGALCCCQCTRDPCMQHNFSVHVCCRALRLPSQREPLLCAAWLRGPVCDPALSHRVAAGRIRRSGAVQPVEARRAESAGGGGAAHAAHVRPGARVNFVHALVNTHPCVRNVMHPAASPTMPPALCTIAVVASMSVYSGTCSHGSWAHCAVLCDGVVAGADPAARRNRTGCKDSSFWGMSRSQSVVQAQVSLRTLHRHPPPTCLRACLCRSLWPAASAWWLWQL